MQWVHNLHVIADSCQSNNLSLCVCYRYSQQSDYTRQIYRMIWLKRKEKNGKETYRRRSNGDSSCVCCVCNLLYILPCVSLFIVIRIWFFFLLFSARLYAIVKIDQSAYFDAFCKPNDRWVVTFDTHTHTRTRHIDDHINANRNLSRVRKCDNSAVRVCENWQHYESHKNRINRYKWSA